MRRASLPRASCFDARDKRRRGYHTARVIVVGELSLWVGLLMAAWATTVSFAGVTLRRDDLVSSGRRGLYATFAMVLLASVGLWTALLSRDFSLEYVAGHISANLPNVYAFTAFWSGPAGSTLFCALILSMFSAIAIATNRNRDPELVTWVAGTLGAILVFFIATTCFTANPFTRLDWTPPDGRGMNPQFQNPGMALHAPTLYLGYVATAIPFAFAIGALASRRLDTMWLSVVRRWSVISWFFLTIGIVLGMWWAYVELGSSRYWAWDPVENASLLPWLTGTALLHSIIIQEKTGMFRKWSVVLVVTTFLFSVLGTFLTRNAVVDGVDSFDKSPIGMWFGWFALIATGVAVYLVGTRLRDLRTTAKVESMVSREAALLSNSLVLCGVVLAVLSGTLFPILSESMTGKRITVGPPFFNAVNVPLGLLVLALTGIGPLIAWRHASVSNLKRLFAMPLIIAFAVLILLVALGMRAPYSLVTYALSGFVTGTIVQEFYKGVGARRSIHGESLVTAFHRLLTKNRRRYGGYIVHAGVAMLFAGFAGLAFKRDHNLTLRAGEAAQVRDPFGHTWRFVSQGASTSEFPDRMTLGVTLETWRDGTRVGFITSEQHQYIDRMKRPVFDPAMEVGIRTTPMLDTYIVLAGVRDEVAELRVTFNPLVAWVWAGGFVMMIGGLIVMWPDAEVRRQQLAASGTTPIDGFEITAEESVRVEAAIRGDA
jgi:cytochrome c-type biogenesis protein CcmF